MVRRILRLQRLLLRHQCLELGFALIYHSGVGRGFRVLQVVRLLGDHRLQEGHILLLPIQRLRRRVKLGCQCLQRVRVGLFLVRSLPKYFCWKAASLASCWSRFFFESASCCFRKSVVPSADCFARTQILADEE
jgi:hypothetical protein